MSETKGERTRRRLVDAAGSLLRRRGYHGVGLGEILKEARAPRGSLYFHFPGGKEELAALAVDAEGARWRVRVNEVVSASDGLAAAVVAVGELFASELEQSDFADGCPAATVALEVASESTLLRERCSALYAGWESLIADQLIAAGASESTAGSVARFALCAFEGALLIARVKRSGDPIREVAAVLATQVSGFVSSG
jgi:TetR/AcrR family transcriptional repressor of lmrAB and yxaGH operons